jgi:hypothetical protein
MNFSTVRSFARALSRQGRCRLASPSFRLKLELEYLETRIAPSFADGNGAVITSLVQQDSGATLVIAFDGPLNANPVNPAQSPTNTANYSVQVPAGNSEVVTSSTSSVSVVSASYKNSTNQVTLTLGSALTQGQFYRVFINGVANTENSTAPGLIDANQQALDGDYDDTPSGDFYALFAWTTAGTPLNFTDSQGDQVALAMTGPGELNAWRELNGDFNAGDLTAQANLATGFSVQQISVADGVAGSTTLTGSALFAKGSTGVVVIPPAIPGTFTNALPAYFQPSAPAPAPSTPVVADVDNLPFTLQIQPVNEPAGLPALQSSVAAQDNVSESQFQGYWLFLGGRNNGLHTFNTTDNFPPQDQNESIDVVNPTTGQTWTEAWNATDVSAGFLPPLYSTNQESFQDGDMLYMAGGYGAADQGGGNFAAYTTYDTLTALSVNGLIDAVVNRGDVAALAQIQQIQDQRLKVTGGQMAMLNGLAYLVGGQDFEGEYNPVTNTGFTQTYTDEIQAFQITYVGAMSGSLSIADFQAQNDQVNLRRRDFNLGNILLSNSQPALEIDGGVFTAGPSSLTSSQSGFRNPIVITGIGQTQMSSYQQDFAQYNSANISLFDASTGAMSTIFLGGISLYDVDFATGQLSRPFIDFPPPLAGLPFVDDMTTLVQQPTGASQEYEMPSQLSGFYGSEATFFAAAGLPQYANGVVNFDQLTQTTTLGYMYGGIVSTAGLTSNAAVQTMATNAVFKITLVPNVASASNTTFVDSLYQVLLNRVPSAVELNGWLTTLAGGATTTAVAAAFIASPEHRARELAGFYNLYLNRQPDAPGEQAFLAEYAHGATDQQVITQILCSPEFVNQMTLSGTSGNEVVVTALYTNLLNRAPGASEVAGWVDLLNAGTPLATVVNGFLTSAEYLKDQVDDYYTIYLGRPEDPLGENNWINALHTESSEQVMAGFLGSAEYFGKHPGTTAQVLPA